MRAGSHHLMLCPELLSRLKQILYMLYNGFNGFNSFLKKIKV